MIALKWFKKYLTLLLLLMITLSFMASGLTELSSCNREILDKAGETYVLTKDCQSEGTAFIVKAPNVTIDFNGHALTYNINGKNLIKNSGFESCHDGVPESWDLSDSPNTTCAKKETFWQNYELVMQFTNESHKSIKSNTFTIPANNTYAAFAFVKSKKIRPKGEGFYQRVELWSTNNTEDESDDYILKKCKYGKGSDWFTEPCNSTVSSEAVSSGFAGIGHDVMEYRNEKDEEVYAKVVVTPTNENVTAKIYIDDVSVVPSKRHAIACARRYWDPWHFPDLEKEYPSRCQNLEVKNGRIEEIGRGFSCDCIRTHGAKTTVKNMTLITRSVNGRPLNYWYGKGIDVENSIIRTKSYSGTNRMYQVAQIYENGGEGDVIIKNNLLEGPPQNSIYISRAIELQKGVTIRILNNTLRNNETITEGYSIILVGVNNVEVAYNDIKPPMGRCILLDNAGGHSSVYNVKIHHNNMTWTEHSNAEYDPNGLMAAAVRIREWPDDEDTHQNISIYSNDMFGWINPESVTKVFGFALDLAHENTNTRIVGNRIRVLVNSTNKEMYGAPFDFQSNNPNSGLTVKDNLLISNSYGIKFSDSDGINTYNITLTNNKIIRDKTESGNEFKPTFIGFGHSNDENHRYVNQMYQDTSSEDYRVHYHTNHVSFGQFWLVNVIVKDEEGRPVGFVNVECIGSDGKVYDSKVSSDTGIANVECPEWIMEGKYPSLDKNTLTPVTLRVSKNGVEATKVLNINEPTRLEMVLGVEGSGSYRCGNGVLEPGELCDGNDLGFQNCITQGFDFGVLRCNPDCESFDYSDCNPKVGVSGLTNRCSDWNSRQGDLDCSSKVDVFDLTLVGSTYDCSEGSACWSEKSEKADGCTKDDVVDVLDLNCVSQNFGNKY